MEKLPNQLLVRIQTIQATTMLPDKLQYVTDNSYTRDIHGKDNDSTLTWRLPEDSCQNLPHTYTHTAQDPGRLLRLVKPSRAYHNLFDGCCQNSPMHNDIYQKFYPGSEL